MSKTVVVIGGGPIGLAAAAHAIERGLNPVVFEAGPHVGETVRAWQHVRMFSAWQLNLDKACQRLLETCGWTAPDPDAYPSGREFREGYLEPLARVPELLPRIRLATRVVAVTRVEHDKLADARRLSVPFEVAFEAANGSEGRLTADAVIDCSGNWEQPRPAGAGGVPAVGERNVRGRLHYGPVDVLGALRVHFSGKKVAVLGNRHSAICTLIDLARLAGEALSTRPIWLVRSETARNGPPGSVPKQLQCLGEMLRDIEHLTSVGQIELRTGFSLKCIEAAGDHLRLQATNDQTLIVDELIVATGFRPNFDFLRELRLDLHSTLECPSAIAPLIDPAVHTARTVSPHGAKELGHPDRDFFLAGIKSYGRAATFLLIVGYEQVRSIVAHLAEDHDAASRVELSLPW